MNKKSSEKLRKKAHLKEIWQIIYRKLVIAVNSEKHEI